MLLSTPSLFHDGGPYHIETSPLIYRANQWTSFYVIGASIMKELTLCGICPVQKIQYSFLDEGCFRKTFKLKRCLLSYNSVRYQLAAFILYNILEIEPPAVLILSSNPTYNQWQKLWEKLLYGQFLFSPLFLLNNVENNKQNLRQDILWPRKIVAIGEEGGFLNPLFKIPIIFCHWLSEIY